MTDRSLRACRILVVEDEYMLADELALELIDAGAEVLGPAPTIERALAVLEDQAAPDGAILDVNLGGVPVFPLADTLIERGVPWSSPPAMTPIPSRIGSRTCRNAASRSTSH